MEKPYFLMSSTSGKAQMLIDRREQSDESTKAMRERLTTGGCTQKEITQKERDKIVNDEKGFWI